MSEERWRDGPSHLPYFSCCLKGRMTDSFCWALQETLHALWVTVKCAFCTGMFSFSDDLMENRNCFTAARRVWGYVWVDGYFPIESSPRTLPSPNAAAGTALSELSPSGCQVSERGRLFCISFILISRFPFELTHTEPSASSFALNSFAR